MNPILNQAQPAPQSLLPGVSIVTGQSNLAPSVLVLGAEKSGKSTCGMSLVDWPRQGMHPLFLAWDENGPNSCLNLGYQPHVIVIAKQPGTTLWDKARGTLVMLASQQQRLKAAYGSIIVDDVSTMIGFLLDDYRRTTKNPDPRHPYAEVGRWHQEFLNRICELGLPNVWLAWLKEAEWIDEKTPAGQKIRKLISGGPLVEGRQIRAQVAGRAHHIFALEKAKHGIGSPNADAEGYVRQLHARPWQDIVLGGRFADKLPPICPPHLGWIFSQVTGIGPHVGAGK